MKPFKGCEIQGPETPDAFCAVAQEGNGPFCLSHSNQTWSMRIEFLNCMKNMLLQNLLGNRVDESRKLKVGRKSRRKIRTLGLAIY